MPFQDHVESSPFGEYFRRVVMRLSGNSLECRKRRRLWKVQLIEEAGRVAHEIVIEGGRHAESAVLGAGLVNGLRVPAE